MAKRFFNLTDINNARVNNQAILSGTSATDLQDNVAYFIYGVEGTTVTIKDKNDVTQVVFANSNYLNNPIRIDGGIKISASATAYVMYFTIEYGI